MQTMFGWQRVAWTLVLSVLAGLFISIDFAKTPAWVVASREMAIALACLVAFGIFERWPARLPRWLARWALQVLAVAFVVPWTVVAVYVFTTPAGDPPFYRVEARLNGAIHHMLITLLVAPWAAVAALFHKGDFERNRLERQALDARLRLIESQVEPHFLFNTLANVRELVDQGSPQASAVLGSLIAYLRAAVPRLHDPATTMGHELQLVKAYLELMQMRMPDRLRFEIDADEAAKAARCPPTSLLTLVENAIRHGIDPAEDGGRIDVRVRVRDGRCVAEVSDTGVGISPITSGLGTGLSTLRERLQLAFGGDAELRIASIVPHGVRAEVEFPRDMKRPTALIADDEPLLRRTLARMLAAAWPELEVVAEARNGRETIEMFDAQKPDVCFLDVHMPGISGVEAARHIGQRAHLVFVTAFDEYAVEAFARGALDYLVKPVEPERIAETVSRLKDRIARAAPVASIETLIDQLAERLERKSAGTGKLRWIHAAVGQNLRLIDVESIDFVRADDKYTVIAWRDHEGKPSEALIRMPLKELIAQLDERFVQVHRSVIVNRHSISHVSRSENETAHVHLRGRGDVLPVSRSYLHLFKQM